MSSPLTIQQRFDMIKRISTSDQRDPKWRDLAGDAASAGRWVWFFDIIKQVYSGNIKDKIIEENLRHAPSSILPRLERVAYSTATKDLVRRQV
ncbi:MAG: hypothetical protein LCH53_03750 [Bacteroidetes bacterium]|nr:hypothetical protein [Bacteroidota bacterium]